MSPTLPRAYAKGGKRPVETAENRPLAPPVPPLHALILGEEHLGVANLFAHDGEDSDFGHVIVPRDFPRDLVAVLRALANLRARRTL